MRVVVVGGAGNFGARIVRALRTDASIELLAAGRRGSSVPCMAATLLARRLSKGDPLASGAFPCMGFLTLSAFEPEFARWGITTRVEEVSA